MLISTIKGMTLMKTQGLPSTYCVTNDPAVSRPLPLYLLLKKTLLLALPLVLIFALGIFGHYSQQIASVEQNASKMNQYVNQIFSLKLQQILRNIKGDALLLTSNPLLPQVFLNPWGIESQLLAQQWVAFSAQKRIYDQLRLLDLHGQEILRINLTDTGAKLIPNEQLQNKANRYYFKDAMSLPPGKIYLSPLDLNIENQEIEQPIKPMLRIGTPIVNDKHSKVGLLILNYLAANIMDEINTYSVLAESKNLLLNQQGYYLHGVDKKRAWRFMYPQLNQDKGKFSFDHADVWRQIESTRQDHLVTDKGIFSFNWLSSDDELTMPNRYTRQFVMVSMISSEQLEALQSPYRKSALETSIIALISIFLFSALISYFRLRELNAFERLRSIEAKQRLILESVGEGIVGIDAAGRLTFANSRAEQLTGYRQSEMLGRPLHSLVHACKDDHSPHLTDACPIQQSIITGKSHREESDTFIGKEGHTFPVEYISNPIIKNGELHGAVVSFFDITARKQAEKHIEYLVLYNPLTDLPNKRLFLDRLEQQLVAARSNNLIAALIYIDIDRFKQINDVMGHSSGDEILIETARRLKYISQKGDTIAHIGSDEFVVLMANHSVNPDIMAQSAQLVADEIMLILEQPYFLEQDTVRITACIGITIFPLADENASTILAQADTAVASAKQSGRYTTRFFKSEMEQSAKGWLKIHNRMLETLAHDAFTLVYQPEVDQHGHLIGIEALLRWEDEKLGTVKPNDFIPLAEQSGLIQQVNDFVLTQVCKQVKTWSDAGLMDSHIRVAVNISPTQFNNRDFVAYMLKHIDQAEIDANTIELEITERTLVHDTTTSRDTLHTLRKHGIRFSIDDFGTGYSSLAYLQQLPLDRLKIDRAFITNVDKIKDRQSIVEAIILLAKGLSIDVIAEGVETQEEMNFLLKIGCKTFQGYYFHRPTNPDMITELLRENMPIPNNSTATQIQTGSINPITQ
jgi:diguanylate cyclase (GGDEF)-like protein/PAS domain S-box-containing protein